MCDVDVMALERRVFSDEIRFRSRSARAGAGCVGGGGCERPHSRLAVPAPSGEREPPLEEAGRRSAGGRRAARRGNGPNPR